MRSAARRATRATPPAAAASARRAPPRAAARRSGRRHVALRLRGGRRPVDPALRRASRRVGLRPRQRRERRVLGASGRARLRLLQDAAAPLLRGRLGHPPSEPGPQRGSARHVRARRLWHELGRPQRPAQPDRTAGEPLGAILLPTGAGLCGDGLQRGVPRGGGGASRAQHPLRGRLRAMHVAAAATPRRRRRRRRRLRR